MRVGNYNITSNGKIKGMAVLMGWSLYMLSKREAIQEVEEVNVQRALGGIYMDIKVTKYHQPGKGGAQGCEEI